MRIMSSYRVLCLWLMVLLFAGVTACAEKSGSQADQQDYQIIRRVILQPVDHNDPDGPKLEQHVDILIPKGTPLDAPVFFILGNEMDLDDEFLFKMRRLHGEDAQIIYIQAEHRGYGQSLTRDEDQSVPSYVRIDQALADAHEVIVQLKEDYPGPWMAAGWSYGGGLIINFAARYPQDIKVILSSSGVVDWPLLNVDYDRQVRKTLSKGCYKRLAEHANNLAPKERFDKTWLEREFLNACVVGFVQFDQFRGAQPFFELSSYLPTGAFLKVLHWIDDTYGEGEGWRYARALGTQTIGKDEVAQGVHNWHAWRYQQCTQTGVFFVSEMPDSLFTRTAEDVCAECEALFGEEPPDGDRPEWSLREMVEALAVPLIYVSGGQDPWMALCLEADYTIENGKYFYVPEGRHCPERDDPELARDVLAEMLKYAGYEQ